MADDASVFNKTHAEISQKDIIAAGEISLLTLNNGDNVDLDKLGVSKVQSESGYQLKASGGQVTSPYNSCSKIPQSLGVPSDSSVEGH